MIVIAIDRKNLENESRQNPNIQRATLCGSDKGVTTWDTQECGLTKYYSYFRSAGFDLVELFKFRSDTDVEDLLNVVEKHHKIRFPYRHRILLWKAFRYRSFQAPQANRRRLVNRREIPLLVLPKKDYRIRDAAVAFRNLEPDRQRMIMRKTESDEVEGTRVVQYEIFKRQVPIHYEILGLQRCLEEWRNLDPRKMAREDPREEAFLMQAHALELRCAAGIDKLKRRQKELRIIRAMITLVRWTLGAMAGLSVGIAFGLARSSASSNGFFSIFVSSNQFMATTILVTAFAFVSGIARSRRSMVALGKYKAMHAICKSLYVDMISFRLSTQTVRLARVEVPLDDVERIGPPPRGAKALDNNRQSLSAPLPLVDDPGTFNNWFAPIMAVGLPDPLQMQAGLEDTKRALLPVDPSLSLHPKDSGFVDRGDAMLEKLVPPLSLQDKRAVPHSAIIAQRDFYNHDRELQAIENLREEERELEWFENVSEDSEDYSNEDEDRDDDRGSSEGSSSYTEGSSSVSGSSGDDPSGSYISGSGSQVSQRPP